MSEKKITKAEYDEAIKKAIHEVINDPDVKGEMKFLIPMTGMIFTQKISSVLFGSEDENKEEKNNG